MVRDFLGKTVDDMNNEKQVVSRKIPEDEGIRNLEFFKQLFDELKISDNLGAIELGDNLDGSGSVIRFGFFR
jgi:hypothetical protein